MEWLAKWTTNKQWKKITQEQINIYSILEEENSKFKVNEWPCVETLFHIQLQLSGLCSKLPG